MDIMALGSVATALETMQDAFIPAYEGANLAVLGCSWHEL